jgi:hypothetical protein
VPLDRKPTLRRLLSVFYALMRRDAVDRVVSAVPAQQETTARIVSDLEGQFNIPWGWRHRRHAIAAHPAAVPFPTDSSVTALHFAHEVHRASFAERPA